MFGLECKIKNFMLCALHLLPSHAQRCLSTAFPDGQVPSCSSGSSWMIQPWAAEPAQGLCGWVTFSFNLCRSEQKIKWNCTSVQGSVQSLLNSGCNVLSFCFALLPAAACFRNGCFWHIFKLSFKIRCGQPEALFT